MQSWGQLGQLQGIKEAYTYWKDHAIDSSASISKFYEIFSEKGKDGKQTKTWVSVHPMQSIFLGSDRRYNRYWLFLGPCSGNDPGHRRVYFESSEDGHWEVIDTEEVIPLLLYDYDYSVIYSLFPIGETMLQLLFSCLSSAYFSRFT